MMRLALAVAAFSLIFAAAAQAEYVGPPRTQATPPVFKDAQANPPALPPDSQPGDNTAGTIGTPITEDSDPGGQTTVETAPAEETADDPCAGSMDNIDSYTVCQDMIQKIERMKKGNAARKEVYHPKPKKEEKKEEAKDGEKKDGEKTAEAGKDKKDGDKKEEEKKDGDKDKKESDGEKKDGDSSAKKDESGGEEEKTE